MLGTIAFLSAACATVVIGLNVDADDAFLDSRIVGGRNTTIAEYPYQVSLQVYGQHFCGGSIISSDFILTANHCFSPMFHSYKVRVGSSYPNEGGLLYDVAQVITHPNFTRSNFDFDVSLVRVEKPFTFSDFVQFVPLVDVDEEVIEGTVAIVTGWGFREEKGKMAPVLQELEVPLLSNEHCNRMFPDKIISPRMLCAAYIQGGRDACQGDSGGPIVTDKQVGIVSWGSGCARPNKPGVYTRIAAVRDWIKEKSGV